MASWKPDDSSTVDFDDCTDYTGPCTPPESAANDPPPDFTITIPPPDVTSVPHPGSTFIIKSRETGLVITLLGGQVVLASPASRRESTHWRCVEADGWLGFRHPISNKFLGHDKHGRLRCEADAQEGWERFCVRPSPAGGYALLMQHWHRLFPVGVRVEGRQNRLMRVETAVSNGHVWDFLEV